MVSIYTPLDRRLPTELSRLAQGLRDVQRPTGTQREQTLLRLTEMVGEVQAQVAELSARSSHTVQPAPMEISSSTPGIWPTDSTTCAFPAPPGGARVATLQLSGEFVRAAGTGNMSVFLELLQDGVSTWKRHNAFMVGDTASAPPAWGNPAADEFIQVRVPSAAAANMQLRIYGHVFVGTPITARMQNITATLTYGARI